MTTPAKVFHMPDYLVGSPERIVMLSSNGGNEICWTEYDPKDPRHCWFVKNGNAEEFAFHSDFVWRGTDTSPSESEYYQQWSVATGKLGAKWCPLTWRVGVPVLREVEIRYFYKLNGQKRGEPYRESSYLEIMAHHASKAFPDGLTINDVLEIAWYHKADEPKLERYFYAYKIGLVGFQNAQGFASHITRLSAGPALPRKFFPGIQPMTLPPALPVKTPPKLPERGDPMWKPYTLVSVTGQNLRTNTKINDEEFAGTVLGGGPVPDGAKVMVINEPGLVYLEEEDNNFTWYGVWWLDKDLIGWMALRTGAEFEDQFEADGVPVPPPPPEEEEPEPPDEPPGEEEPENPPSMPEPQKDPLIVHVALTQLRAMMIRKTYVQDAQARLDKEAQGLMADIITMTNLLEAANIDLPDWALN